MIAPPMIAMGIAGTGAADEAGLTAALACAWEVAARRRQTGRRRSVA